MGGFLSASTSASRFILLCLFLTVICLLESSIAFADETEFECFFRWEKGEKTKYEALIHSEITLKSRTVKMQSRFIIENEVLSVDSEGTANIVTTISSSSGVLEGRIYSDKMEKEIVLKRVNRWGEIEYLSTGREDEELALLDISFPRGKLKIKDSWVSSAHFPADRETLTLLSTFTLENVRDGIATISVITVKTALDDNGVLEKKKISEGTALFDVLNGKLVYMEITSEIPYVLSETKENGTLKMLSSLKLVE